MKRFLIVLVFGALAIAGASGCGSYDCVANENAYAEAAAAAQRCDPTAATPCVVYAWRGCGVIGINPDAGSALDALTAEYAAAGCPMANALPCPYATLPTYVCQAGADGGNTCTSSR